MDIKTRLSNNKATYSNPWTHTNKTHLVSTKDYTAEIAYLSIHTTIKAAPNVHTAAPLQSHCRICSCIPRLQTSRTKRHNHQSDQLTTQPTCSLVLPQRAYQQHVFSAVNQLKPFALSRYDGPCQTNHTYVSSQWTSKQDSQTIKPVTAIHKHIQMKHAK